MRYTVRAFSNCGSEDIFSGASLVEAIACAIHYGGRKTTPAYKGAAGTGIIDTLSGSSGYIWHTSMSTAEQIEIERAAERNEGTHKPNSKNLDLARQLQTTATAIATLSEDIIKNNGTRVAVSHLDEEIKGFAEILKGIAMQLDF